MQALANFAYDKQPRIEVLEKRSMKLSNYSRLAMPAVGLSLAGGALAIGLGLDGEMNLKLVLAGIMCAIAGVFMSFCWVIHCKARAGHGIECKHGVALKAARDNPQDRLDQCSAGKSQAQSAACSGVEVVSAGVQPSQRRFPDIGQWG